MTYVALPPVYFGPATSQVRVRIFPSWTEQDCGALVIDTEPTDRRSADVFFGRRFCDLAGSLLTTSSWRFGNTE